MDQENTVIPLLRVSDLFMNFCNTVKKGNENILNGASFTVNRGEIVGIVGESGSGKSITALSIMGLLPKDGKIQAGSISYCGTELLTLPKEDYQKLRGSELSMVFQEPMTSLNPLLSIGNQVEEVIKLHEKISAEERKKRVIDILSEVDLSEPCELMKKYPYQLSGGMRQRIMIAMAMVCHPKLLIADEPTTALDVTIQSKILMLLKRMNETYGTAILFISHDLGVIRKICSRALIMYQGKIIEEGRVEQLFLSAKQEYTKHLLESAGFEKSVISSQNGISAKTDTTILKVDHLNVFYPEKKAKLFEKRQKKQAVKEADLIVKKGEILGIVGESGCGKSSLAKAIAGLIDDYTGEIVMNCKRPQMVFQDPYGSLNPSKRIGWLLEEPLRLQSKQNQAERREKVFFLLDKVGLKPEYARRYPSELSGGQRQRVAIAMAVILNNELIILDEPVSALDASIQKQIIDLLLSIKQEFDLSYLFISHDMKVVRKMCDRVCVMYQGEIIETADTESLFLLPKQEYTKKLLSSIL